MSAAFPDFIDFWSNASFNSTQEYFWEFNKPEYGVATACVLLLYFFGGLPMNFLVAGTILLKKSLQTASTHTFLQFKLDKLSPVANLCLKVS